MGVLRETDVRDILLENGFRRVSKSETVSSNWYLKVVEAYGWKAEVQVETMSGNVKVYMSKNGEIEREVQTTLNTSYILDPELFFNELDEVVTDIMTIG